MKRLAAEREKIRLEEQALLDEVQRLNNGIMEREDQYEATREQLQNRLDDAQNIGMFVKNRKLSMLKEQKEYIEMLRG